MLIDEGTRKHHAVCHLNRVGSDETVGESVPLLSLQEDLVYILIVCSLRADFSRAGLFTERKV